MTDMEMELGTVLAVILAGWEVGIHYRRNNHDMPRTANIEY
jgi:hypothetical protein